MKISQNNLISLLLNKKLCRNFEFLSKEIIAGIILKNKEVIAFHTKRIDITNTFIQLDILNKKIYIKHLNFFDLNNRDIELLITKKDFNYLLKIYNKYTNSTILLNEVLKKQGLLKCSIFVAKKKDLLFKIKKNKKSHIFEEMII